jgi:uncharacterized protein Usg
MCAMVSEDFRKQTLGYGLTTAHILYRRPDHRWLLQSYIWQNYDLFPEFPELHRFLAFWQMKPQRQPKSPVIIDFAKARQRRKQPQNGSDLAPFWHKLEMPKASVSQRLAA